MGTGIMDFWNAENIDANIERVYDNVIFKIPFYQNTVVLETLRLYYSRMDSKAHWNNGYEVHIITQGSAVYSLNGIQDFHLKPGELLVIPPHLMHSETVMPGTEGICLGFQLLVSKKAPVAASEIHSEADALMSIFDSYSNQYFYSKSCHKLLACFSELNDELNYKKQGCLLYAQNILSNILIELSRIMGSKEADVVLPQKQPKDNCFHIISEYFNLLSKSTKREFTLAELAELMYMSERQVSRFLLKHYGKTFVQILNDTKINYIKFLLNNTSLSVEEIAEKCNWTAKYLYRCFQEYTKTTPAKFRKLSQNRPGREEKTSPT